MSRATPLQNYERATVPLLDGDGGDWRYLQEELGRIEASLHDAFLLIPQPAVSVPKALLDGMQRFARSPWRPVGGAVDVWVYWDAKAAVWAIL